MDAGNAGHAIGAAGRTDALLRMPGTPAGPGVTGMPGPAWPSQHTYSATFDGPSNVDVSHTKHVSMPVCQQHARIPHCGHCVVGNHHASGDPGNVHVRVLNIADDIQPMQWQTPGVSVNVICRRQRHIIMPAGQTIRRKMCGQYCHVFVTLRAKTDMGTIVAAASRVMANTSTMLGTALRR